MFALLYCFLCARFVGRPTEFDPVRSDVDPNTSDLVPIIWTENELLKATDGFNPDCIIGVGSRTKVYRAILPDGNFVAAKILQPDDSRAEKELFREVNTIAKLRHRNILRVLGMFSSPEIKALILEFMPFGSLHQNLYGDAASGLTWHVRLNIALGVAQGIVYLHHGFFNPIIHRDLNPRNILLDSCVEPKIADFGLRKFGHWGEDGGVETFISTFGGTAGYIPGEYGTATRVSTKGDVYSFGIVVLELVTRKQPSVDDFGEHLDMVSWVRDAFPDKALDIIDKDLLKDGGISSTEKQQMVLLMHVGLLCTQEVPKHRPQMNEVLEKVKHIKEIGVPTVANRTLDELINAPPPRLRLHALGLPTQVGPYTRIEIQGPSSLD